jgi:hypothetical protein
MYLVCQKISSYNNKSVFIFRIGQNSEGTQPIGHDEEDVYPVSLPNILVCGQRPKTKELLDLSLFFSWLFCWLTQ